ncbi:MAG: chemotaxis protein CheD [Terriglobia bacterium]|nr:MAG: chemotaxis protein CheD [Terriglobia bacterium]
MERIVVGMADCQIGAAPQSALITYALGSCIGLTLYDPVVALGGLLHFMLPDSTLDPARARDNPWMFADTGIPLLLDKLCAKGAAKRRLVAYAVGAAQILDSEGIFEIGKRNYLATRRLLWKHGLLLAGEAVGGVDYRTVTLEIGTGRLLLQEAGRHRELAPAGQKKGGPPWPTAF